jgi:DDE superfamily endonuclease
VLAKEMLAEVLAWFPKHTFTLVADGAYACKELLGELDHQRVLFVSRIRSAACVYDPRVPPARPGKKGPKAQKGPKLPKPKEAAAKADRKRSSVGAWLWQSLELTLYGESCRLRVVR